jgi:hypothetical protein
MEDFKYIDRETVQAVARTLSESPHPADQNIARYLNKSLGVKTNELSKSQVPDSAVQQLELSLLQTGVSGPEQRGVGPRHSIPGRLAREFVARMLRELRRILCDPKKDRGKLGSNSQAVLAALAAYVMGTLHLSSYATATGLAALVLIALGRASKKAFCDMTDDEALDALTRS